MYASIKLRIERSTNMDFEKARFNMVEQQIRPWDVLDFDILDALEEIGREHFRRRGFSRLGLCGYGAAAGQWS